MLFFNLYKYYMEIQTPLLLLFVCLELVQTRAVSKRNVYYSYHGVEVARLTLKVLVLHPVCQVNFECFFSNEVVF